MHTILRDLQDVPGVIGSFVVSSSGTLVDKAMPAVVGDDVYPDLGRRLATALETLDATISSFDDVLMKFDEHSLYCRRLQNGILSIISSATVNYPALRMATNIASAKIDPLIPDALTAPATAPVAAPAPPATAAPKRFWRGQAVD